MNQVNIFDSDKIFNYSLDSEQVLGMLHSIRNKNADIDDAILIKAKKFIETIENGALLQNGKDLNTLTSSKNLFMYNYGSGAIKELNNASNDSEIQIYLQQLSSYIKELEKGNTQNITNLESFFETVAILLDRDIDNLKNGDINHSFSLAF